MQVLRLVWPKNRPNFAQDDNFIAVRISDSEPQSQQTVRRRWRDVFLRRGKLQT